MLVLTREMTLLALLRDNLRSLRRTTDYSFVSTKPDWILAAVLFGPMWNNPIETTQPHSPEPTFRGLGTLAFSLSVDGGRPFAPQKWWTHFSLLGTSLQFRP